MDKLFSFHIKKCFKFSKQHAIFFLCVVLALSAAVVVMQTRIPPAGEILVVSHNDFTENGGPITIIDLKNGEFHKPSLPIMIGCDGVSSSISQSTDILVYCRGGAEDELVWSIDLNSFTTTHYRASPSINKMFQSPLRARLVIGSDGAEYYSSGGPIFIDDNFNASDAGVVIRQGESVAHVYISDRKKTYFVFRMVLDEETQKVWVMSMGDGEKVLIDRIDISSQIIDFSTTIESYAGFDMVLNDEDVVVSTYRTEEGSDVFVFNKHSGEKVKEITLPVDEDRVLNALSMLRRGDALYISSTGGLYALDPVTYATKEFIANNPEGYFTHLVEGSDAIYAISDFNAVFKIPDIDIRRPELLLSAPEGGLANLHFINRQ